MSLTMNVLVVRDLALRSAIIKELVVECVELSIVVESDLEWLMFSSRCVWASEYTVAGPILLELDEGDIWIRSCCGAYQDRLKAIN